MNDILKWTIGEPKHYSFNCNYCCIYCCNCKCNWDNCYNCCICDKYCILVVVQFVLVMNTKKNLQI